MKWRGWFVFAVTALGLAPDAFWSLSAEEWSWLLEATAPDPLGPAALDTLLQQYPDDPS